MTPAPSRTLVPCTPIPPGLSPWIAVAAKPTFVSNPMSDVEAVIDVLADVWLSTSVMTADDAAAAGRGRMIDWAARAAAPPTAAVRIARRDRASGPAGSAGIELSLTRMAE